MPEILVKDFPTKFREYLDTVGIILDAYKVDKACIAELAAADEKIAQEIEFEEVEGIDVYNWIKRDEYIKAYVLENLEELFSEKELKEHSPYPDTEIEILTLDEQTAFEEFREQLYQKRN